MSFIDSLEQKFLFMLTRFLALLIISCLLIAIVIGGIMFSQKLFPIDNTKVTLTEVMEVIKPPINANDYNQSQSAQQQAVPDINILPGIKIPFILQKYFNNPDSINVLKGWIENIPKEQREEFIRELATVVEGAEKTNADVTLVINKYSELKFNKLKDSQLAKTETNMIRLQYFGFAFACVALIALFSLILVLLAIERNTRKGSAV